MMFAVVNSISKVLTSLQPHLIQDLVQLLEDDDIVSMGHQTWFQARHTIINVSVKHIFFI